MTIPSASVPFGRHSLIRQVATAAAVLAAVLAAATIPAAAAPSSIAPPPNSSVTSVPPPPTGATVPPTARIDTRDGTGNRDGSGTSDGYTLILEVPSTAVQGTTITVHGGNWLCSKVTVTPGWTTSATTVSITSYKFDTTVTVPTSATPGKSTLTATCTTDSSITATKPITVLAARKVTTDPIVTSDPDEGNPIPTAEAQAPENKSGTLSIGPLAVSAVLILAAIVGALNLLGRRTPATESPTPGGSRVPGPAPFRSRETDTAQPGVRAPGASPFDRRTVESPRFGSPAPSPHHTGRVPDVQIRVHQDQNPRLDIRTIPSRPPNVQIRVHRAEPITTVREVRR
ncbi:hypothetical protein [Nocardia anaemiae]|uniref:hypothetical protein n=1 Tax=Nocardia anaemiae TaxID=263910 RepID=UPI000A68538B|nr:hypothetical protein [Nocardia anaemiae]